MLFRLEFSLLPPGEHVVPDLDDHLWAYTEKFPAEWGAVAGFDGKWLNITVTLDAPDVRQAVNAFLELMVAAADAMGDDLTDNRLYIHVIVDEPDVRTAAAV